MITCKCDRCSKQIDSWKTIDVPVHIQDIANGRTPTYTSSRGLLDEDIDLSYQGSSGRTEQFEVCIECYNRVHLAAYRKLTEKLT